MIISSLEIQKKRASRVSIFIDGEFALGMSLDLLAALNLKKGMSVSESEVQVWRSAAIFDEAKSAAYGYLARRAHSRKELYDKLKKKQFPLETIEAVLSQLAEKKLINDAAFAALLVRDRLKKKPVGKNRLQNELRRKGVRRETAERVLATTDLHANDLCLKAAERKLKSLAREPDRIKKKKKLSDFLMRRGFEWDIIRHTVDALFKAEGE